MEADALEIFLAAARTESVLGAAEACHTSRGRVRRKLEELEERAGTALFERTRTGLVLTAAGSLLRERAGPLLRELDAVMDNVRRVGEDATGTLTIAANTLTPSVGVPEFFAMCRQTMPRVSVEGHACTDVPAMVRAGHEVGLLLAEELPVGPWSAFRAFSLEAGLFATPEYAENNGVPTTLSELAEHRLVGWMYPGYDGRSIPVRGAGRTPIDPVLVCSYGEPLWSLVQRGEAIGNFAASAFTAQELVRVLPQKVSYQVHLWVLLSRAAMTIPRVRQLHRAMQLISKEVTPERTADDE